MGRVGKSGCGKSGKLPGLNSLWESVYALAGIASALRQLPHAAADAVFAALLLAGKIAVNSFRTSLRPRVERLLKSNRAPLGAD
ncbi:hypothetical protein GCM10007907_29130 [Chitinimonas prasina]|uniref:Uncharacterized protein n=1 Tax=Chitinimonas prasina TaxID=1434937 RepID=A0ABQ5YKC6_9NEIS|nr:hypothetical protein GCM10007907_29130 [Chitinimonas prasina]